MIIASPPHWHALMAIDACEAGKDLYLQKPMTLHLAESVAVKRAVKMHHRICQVGTQCHSGTNYPKVVEKIRSGMLGKINVARTFNVLNLGADGIGHDPTASAAEPGLEPLGGSGADAGLQPADRQGFFHPLLIHGLWRRLDSRLGPAHHRPADLGPRPRPADDGQLVGRPLRGPRRRRRARHAETLLQYPGFTLTWMMSQINSYGFDLQGSPGPRRRLGVYFHGVDGTLYADYASHAVVPEGKRMKPVEPYKDPAPAPLGAASGSGSMRSAVAASRVATWSITTR